MNPRPLLHCASVAGSSRHLTTTAPAAQITAKASLRRRRGQLAPTNQTATQATAEFMMGRSTGTAPCQWATRPGLWPHRATRPARWAMRPRRAEAATWSGCPCGFYAPPPWGKGIRKTAVRLRKIALASLTSCCRCNAAAFIDRTWRPVVLRAGHGKSTKSMRFTSKCALTHTLWNWCVQPRRMSSLPSSSSR